MKTVKINGWTFQQIIKNGVPTLIGRCQERKIVHVPVLTDRGDHLGPRHGWAQPMGDFQKRYFDKVARKRDV